jgi:outer membrane translocation and assembly module TamA
MAGDRLLRANLELGRATALQPFGVFRLGLAAFTSAGAAWWDDEARSARDLRQEVGVGLRFGSVRSSKAEMVRLDIAWPLDGGGPEIAAETGGLF